jgi:thioredoxin 1
MSDNRPNNKSDNKGENKVIEIESAEQYDELFRKGLVVVDFNTTFCGPCRQFAPIFRQIAKRFDGITFLSVNCEKIEHTHCETVTSVPTFRIFFNGDLRREFTGANEEKLIKYIKRYDVQIFIHGKLQRNFTPEIKHHVHQYIDEHISNK